MATPQELYDETKTRLDLNIAKAQMLEREIQEKVAEKNQLMQPIIEDQGALKQFAKLPDVVTEPTQTVESK
jgi:light-regulated signal transduction histidine kinase (bacteriophytochrome)